MQKENNDTNRSIYIDQIKRSELLDYDKIKEFLLYNKHGGKTWEEHAKNFREEDFIKAVGV